MARKSRRKKTNYENFIQGFQKPTNDPRLIRLIHFHPEIATYLQKSPQDVVEEIRRRAVYCKLTESAVRDFQQQKGIQDDGIVGPKTWKGMGYSKRKLKKRTVDYKYQRKGGLEGPPGADYRLPGGLMKRERTGGLEGSSGSIYPMPPPP
ncbi:MAG: peptidoglycan-binding domain-containing protein [Cyanobacteriota bacterium]|jgi:hypothetical protein